MCSKDIYIKYVPNLWGFPKKQLILSHPAVVVLQIQGAISPLQTQVHILLVTQIYMFPDAPAIYS